MKTNREFYAATIFDGRLPCVEIGQPVLNERTGNAWDAALERAISQQLAEMGTSTEGELFDVTKPLRKACAECGAPIPRDVIQIVRWKLTDAETGEKGVTLHKLTGDREPRAAATLPEPAARRARERGAAGRRRERGRTAAKGRVAQPSKELGRKTPMRITITGVDAAFGAADLLKLHQLEPTVEVEFAVLFGTRTGRQGEPRYPPRNTVEAFAAFARSTGVRAALHLCGRAARSAVSGQAPDELVTLAKAFQRVQINGCETRLDGMVEFGKSVGVPVIAQVGNGFEGPEVGPSSLHYLYDASGGRGISRFAAWPRARTDAWCGYAGGIGPRNVKKAVRHAEARGGSWIDMRDAREDRRPARPIEGASSDPRGRPGGRGEEGRGGGVKREAETQGASERPRADGGNQPETRFENRSNRTLFPDASNAGKKSPKGRADLAAGVLDPPDDREQTVQGRKTKRVGTRTRPAPRTPGFAAGVQRTGRSGNRSRRPHRGRYAHATGPDAGRHGGAGPANRRERATERCGAREGRAHADSTIRVRRMGARRGSHDRLPARRSSNASDGTASTGTRPRPEPATNAATSAATSSIPGRTVRSYRGQNSVVEGGTAPSKGSRDNSAEESQRRLARTSSRRAVSGSRSPAKAETTTAPSACRRSNDGTVGRPREFS